MVSFSYGASRIKISFSVVAGMNLVMSGMLGMAVWIGNGFLIYRRQDNRCSGRSFTWWNGRIPDLSLCSDTKAEYDEKTRKLNFMSGIILAVALSIDSVAVGMGAGL